MPPELRNQVFAAAPVYRPDPVRKPAKRQGLRRAMGLGELRSVRSGVPGARQESEDCANRGDRRGRWRD